MSRQMRQTKAIGRQLWKRGERKIARALVEAAGDWSTSVAMMETQLSNMKKYCDNGLAALKKLRKDQTDGDALDTVAEVFLDMGGTKKQGLRHLDAFKKSAGK